MVSTDILSIETEQDDSFLNRLLGMHDRTDFKILAVFYKYEGDGEYIDDNGILWSMAEVKQRSNISSDVLMCTIKPQKTLRLTTEYKKLE